MAENSELTRAQPTGEGVPFDGIAIDRLSHAFETSAKRWELIVYPSMFAFIILAAYGFYLVFSLAKDVHYMAISIDTNMTVLASNMQSMSDNVSLMSGNVRLMATSVESMATDVTTLKPMMNSMESLNQSIRLMTQTTGNMSNDMGNLNRSISRPMGFMNSFMPW
jgi:methyl-accepting chemotaxis protein